MDNIRVKEDSLNNWRAGFEIEEGKKKGLDGKACWDGYKLAGTKKKGGKTVDNCVKEDQVDEGLVTTGLALSAAGGLAAWALPKLKKNVDKKLDKARENLTIGGEYRKKQIEKNTGVKLEQIEGGVNVENYADGVQFNEIETVDIIKPEPLNASNWRNDLIQVDERYKFIGPGKGRKAKDEDMTKHKGEKLGPNYLIPQASINKKKEVVAASHEVEGELVDEGLIKGAIEGGKMLYKIGKWAIPKVGRALKNKGAADIAKFKKSQEVVKRVNNIEKIRTTKALKGADVKGIFTKSKVKPELNRVNWRATVPTVTNRVTTAATKALSPSNISTTTSKVSGKVTKLKRQQITGKAQDILDKMKKGRTLQTRMDKAVSTSNKPGTLSQRTNEIIAQIKADKGSAIVKSQKGGLATQKSRALTRIQQKSSAISNRTQSPTNITTTRGPSASNATVDVKATTVKPKSLSPSVKPKSLSPSQSKSYSAKREYAKGWMAYNKAAGATLRADKASAIARTASSGLVGLTVGGKVGQELGKSKETPKVTPEVKKETPKVAPEIKKETPKVVEKETPKVTPDTKNPPNENKTIIDTEKKKVDPKKNEIVTKDKSSTGDSEKSAWLHKTRNSPAAKSGKFSDDQRWETQKKHRKWKADRKKKKEVSEGAGIAIRVASKIPWGKVASTVAAAKGGEELLKGLIGTPGKPKDNDWVKNPKDDVDRELNTRQNQVKDAAKNKEHDDALKVYGKTIDKKTGKTTLSPEDQIEVIKNAAAKHPSNKKLNKKLNKDKK